MSSDILRTADEGRMRREGERERESRWENEEPLKKRKEEVT